MSHRALDAHVETLFAWDVAAAGLIATEAGAVRTNLIQGPGNIPADLFGEEILTSAPEIHGLLLELLKGGLGQVSESRNI
jgi:myo-inositol-1(or 4)-monophosphatase